MSVKINLLKNAKKHKKRKGSTRSVRYLISGSVILFMLLVIASSSIYVYRLILVKKVNALESDIQKQEKLIDSYKDIEARKSVLTLKTNEIENIYKNKFDYLKAIDDAQQLFGYSLNITSIDLTKEGVVTVVAKKISDITLSQEQAFKTKIKKLNLSVIVPSSIELKDTIDALLSFKGKGLETVVVTSTKLTDEGKYQADFAITFSSTQAKTNISKPLSDSG